MNVTKHIICELTGYRPGTVDVSQGDRRSRAVSCRLMENGTPWMIPDGSVARIAYTLPDGTEGLYDRRPDGTPMWEISGNIVTVILADQIMAQAGMAQMSILIIGPEGGQLATWPIRVMVTANKAARLTTPESMPPYGDGFVGNLFFGGEDGTVTPLAPGRGLDIVQQADGSYVLVAQGGGIQEETDPTVPAWAKQPEKPRYTAQEVGALPAGTKIPAKISDLSNDSGFVTKAVDDLTNYYTKKQTADLIAQIPKFRVTVVQQLPAAGEDLVLYLVPFASESGEYLEYLWLDGRWEVIGSQWVDLKGYATEEWTIAQLGDYLRIDAQALTADQQEQARTNIGAVSRKEVEDLLGIIEEDFSVSGELVEFDLDVEPDTELNVVSKIHRDETWGDADKLVLHQVSGDNFVDLSSYLGGAGKVFEKNGLTATINADSTLTVAGTNTATGWTNIVNITDWSSEYSRRVYPAGTYRIPAGFQIQIRAAQYPESVTIDGLSGNLSGRIVVTEPFRLVSMLYAVAGGATVDTTVPLGLFYGGEIPASEYGYSGSLYTVTFDTPVYEGEYNWATGELKDADGDTVAYYEPQPIIKRPGINYFWTGFGENAVSNLPKNNLEKVVIRLGEAAPDETVPSMCDFTLKPTTPQAGYCLHDTRVLSSGVFYKHEIPLITTKGTISVVDSDGEVTTEKYVDSLINWQGVSDLLTNKGIHKVWSDKFYVTKEPVLREDFSDINNALYTFEFTEEDFQNTGIPAKLDNIPIVSPCFYTDADAASKLNARVWNGLVFPATLSWDASSSKYIFKVRGTYPGYIMAQLTQYTKGYFHYQLEAPYDEAASFAMGISSGDTVKFTVDDSDWKTYLDGGLYRYDNSSSTEPNVTPTGFVYVPRNAEDACAGMINAARMLNNAGEAGGDSTVQGYSWIGKGDGSTDYTSKIQNKLDTLHSITNGGTIQLGPGIYPISGSLIVYSNTKIIGCGIQTTIKQTADNTHAIVLNGNDITLEDFCINLAGACTAITACVYANSNNTTGDNGYPANRNVNNLTMENIFMSGNYKFEYADGKPILGNVYNNYKGVGIRAPGLYFNYAHVDNVHGKHLMATVKDGGGGNYYNITAEYCKYAVYTGGVNCQYFINGHPFYDGNLTDGYVSMSDYVVYEDGGHNNKYSVSVYDRQHFRGYFYFGGCSQSNSYTINANFASTLAAQYTGAGLFSMEHWVVDLGRANIHVAAYQNIPWAIGSKTKQLSGLTSLAVSDPTIRNALSGAGVWGSISSNVMFGSRGLELSEVCRYPSEKTSDVSAQNLPSVVSNVAASEDNPVEIEIDISARPIYAQIGYFIQFDHRYVASDFTVSYDTTGVGVYNISHEVKDNTDVTTYALRHQEPAYSIYRIKFTFTKPLQIENFTYEDSGFRPHTINYNPDGLIGICNIGMTVDDYAGRSFLGACGGSLYGNVDMHRNTLKNLPAPVDDGDAVNRAYLEEELAALRAELAALRAAINGTQ